MSDWDALVNDEGLGMAVKYGADQLLPTVKYLESHFTSEPVYARKKAKHIIYANGKVGLLYPNYNHLDYQNSPNSKAHKDLVRKIGARALVLVKNEETCYLFQDREKYITGGTYKAGSMGAIQGRVSIVTKQEHQVAVWVEGTPGLEALWLKQRMRIDVRKEESRISGKLNIDGKTTIVDNMYDADYIIVATGA